MVTRYGMDERLGHATYEVERPSFLGAPAGPETRPLSEETTRTIDAAVREIVNAAFERAFELLKRHRVVVDAGAKRLLRQETLDQKDLEALQARLDLPAVDARYQNVQLASP